MEFKKLTVQEILDLVEKSGLDVSNFAEGEFDDALFFSDYTPEQMAHVTFFNDYCTPNWADKTWQTYAEKNGLPRYFHTFQEECWKAAGSPVFLGEYEEVASGGGMDRGSDWYSVKYFKDHGVYIRTDGYYQSHHGTDFEDGYGHEVFPKEKTITVYQ
jgi:hypothetical protein